MTQNSMTREQSLEAALRTIFTSTWPRECPAAWSDMMRAAIAIPPAAPPAAPDMLTALRIAHRHPERQHDAGEMPKDCVICAAIARATES